MFSIQKSALLAIVFFAAAALISLDHGIKVQHDSGMYISLGRSLSSGQGYSDIFQAENPPHTKYPPVFPLFLAPLIYLFGYHFLAMKLLIVAMAIFALYLVYVLFRNLSNDFMASLVVIFTAASHGILFYASSIMTEIPYLFFSLLALFWLHKCSRQGDWSRSSVAIAAALIPLVYLTRLVGLSLLLAAVTYLVFDSAGKLAVRMRRALVLGGIATIPALVWFIRNCWVSGQTVLPYWQAYTAGGSASVSSIGSSIVLWDRAITNIHKYILGYAGIIFFNYPWISETVLPLLLALSVFGGFLWCVLRQRTILEHYMFFYMCVVLFFPGSRPQRYLVPLIPFIGYYFFTAAGQIFSWLRGQAIFMKPAYQRGCVFVAMLFLIGLLISNGLTAVLLNSVYRGREDYYHVVGEDRYTSILPWVKAHTPPDSIFVWAKPSLRFLWSERKAGYSCSIYKSEQALLLQSIHVGRVDYVVIDSFSERTQHCRPMIEQCPDCFLLVYKNADSEVYRVIDSPFISGPSAKK